MESFEKYHPLLTEHYKMDWLTTFTLKDIISKFESASKAAKFVNQQMKMVMSNQKLFYGVSERSSNLFIGFVEIHFHDENAQIYLSLNADYEDEILSYLKDFLKANFKIKEISQKKNISQEIF